MSDGVLEEPLAPIDAAHALEPFKTGMWRKLSPAERLRLSEELWRELARGREPVAGWTAAFDTFEQYERWRRGGAGAG